MIFDAGSYVEKQNALITVYYFIFTQEFDPDRFLPERMSKMDAFAFVPFSAGQRYYNYKYSKISVKRPLKK